MFGVLRRISETVAGYQNDFRRGTSLQNGSGVVGNAASAMKNATCDDSQVA
jgi:hypothetical protein